MSLVCIVPVKNETESLHKLSHDLFLNENFGGLVLVRSHVPPITDEYINSVKACYGDKVAVVTSGAGKGLAVLKGLEYYVNVGQQYDAIITLDADGETKVEDGLTVAENAYANAIDKQRFFGKGNRFHGGNGYLSDQDIDPINLLARSLVETRLGRRIYNDPRSGHMSFSPELALELIKRGEIKSVGYGIDAEISCLAHELGYPVVQTDVWFRRQRVRYEHGAIPQEDLEEYINLFGRPSVESALRELNVLRTPAKYI